MSTKAQASSGVWGWAPPGNYFGFLLLSPLLGFQVILTGYWPDFNCNLESVFLVFIEHLYCIFFTWPISMKRWKLVWICTWWWVNNNYTCRSNWPMALSGRFSSGSCIWSFSCAFYIISNYPVCKTYPTPQCFKKRLSVRDEFLVKVNKSAKKKRTRSVYSHLDWTRFVIYKEFFLSTNPGNLVQAR